MKQHDPYLYEDIPVLKNLPGIKNHVKLKLEERHRNRVILGTVYAAEYEKFDTETLRDIHRTIFAPLYEWAGEFRTIPIQKREQALDGKSVRYAPPSEIHFLLDLISEEITRIRPENSPHAILSEVVRVTAKLWQVHPFREGNTRSIVAFSVLLSGKLGIKLNPAVFATRAADVRKALVLCSRGDPSSFEDLEGIYSEAAGLSCRGQPTGDL